MKCILSLAVLTVSLTSCLSLNQPILTDEIIAVEDAKFQTYFISTNTRLPSSLTQSVESAIATKLDALGYEASTLAPDLQIHYEIYEDHFTTLAPVSWTRDEVSPDHADQLRKIKLSDGAIYISFFNKEGQSVVWRGFSDGHSLNPRVVRSKAYEIMDHYQVFAASSEQLISVR